MNTRHAQFSLVAYLLTLLSAPATAEPPEYTAIEVSAWPPSQGPLPFFKRFVPTLPAGVPTNLDAVAQTSSGYVCGDLPGNWYSTSATRIHDASAEYLTPFGQHSWGYWTFDGHDWHYIFGYVRYTHATDINYAGGMVGNSTIAGSSDYASGANTHAYLYSTSGGMLDLTPEAIRSDANSINNRGEIVGWESSATGVYTGFRRSPDGAMTPLEPLDASVSYPAAVNGLGVVVGRAGTKAFVSPSGAAVHDLGMPDTGDIEAVAAYDINDGNWIAGAGWKIAQPYEHFAVIWEPLSSGGWLPWELSELLITPDILLENALAINESGYIIATGRPDGSDVFGSHLYILTPATPLTPPCRPDIGVHPRRSVVVAPGEFFDLGVEIAGGQGPFAYQWSRDGAPLEDGPSGAGSFITGAHGPTLTVTGITAADVGRYVCAVTNACDESLSNAAVVELAAPPCPGDTNGDNLVNFTDLNTVLAAFGQAGQGISGDLNADGVVNFVDLNEVLAAFGAACP